MFLISAQVCTQSLNDTGTGEQIYFATERGPEKPERDTLVTWSLEDT